MVKGIFYIKFICSINKIKKYLKKWKIIHLNEVNFNDLFIMKIKNITFMSVFH